MAKKYQKIIENLPSLLNKEELYRKSFFSAYWFNISSLKVRAEENTFYGQPKNLIFNKGRAKLQKNLVFGTLLFAFSKNCGA